MKKILLIMVVMAIMGNALFAYARDISFTQEDRERIIRLEEGQKSLQRQIDDLKISTQSQIDDLKTSTQRQFDNLYTLILVNIRLTRQGAHNICLKAGVRG